MKLIFLFALLQLSLLSFGQSNQIPATRVFDFDSLMKAKSEQILERPFPNFAAANANERINNRSLKGKVVLINFWFEGCHPCLAEFDALNELVLKLKGNKDFEAISFTWDDAETIKRVQKRYKLQFKVFSATPEECRRLNQNSGYPTTFILNKEGVVKYWNMGGATDTAGARAFVMNTLLPKIQQQL